MEINSPEDATKYVEISQENLKSNLAVLVEKMSEIDNLNKIQNKTRDLIRTLESFIADLEKRKKDLLR